MFFRLIINIKKSKFGGSDHYHRLVWGLFSKVKIQKSKFSRRAEGIGGSGFNPQVGLISMRGNQPPTPLPPPTSSPHTWKDGMGVVVLAF